MKSTELRIGNLVNEFGLPIKIDARILLKLSEIEVKDKICIDLSYIPLTEEWLLKFGFKETDPITFMGGLYSIKKPDGFYINKETMSYCTIDYEGTIDDIIKIEYVHQLQNLYFAVTNEELTMK